MPKYYPNASGKDSGNKGDRRHLLPRWYRRNVGTGNSVYEVQRWKVSPVGIHTPKIKDEVIALLQSIPVWAYVLCVGYWKRQPNPPPPGPRGYDNAQIGVTETVKKGSESPEDAAKRGVLEETGHVLKRGESLRPEKQFDDGKKTWNYYSCNPNQLEQGSQPVLSQKDSKTKKVLTLIYGEEQEMLKLMDQMGSCLLVAGNNPDNIAYLQVVPRNVAISGANLIDISVLNPRSEWINR
jgi:hypothetical protein